MTPAAFHGLFTFYKTNVIVFVSTVRIVRTFGNTLGRVSMLLQTSHTLHSGEGRGVEESGTFKIIKATGRCKLVWRFLSCPVWYSVVQASLVKTNNNSVLDEPQDQQICSSALISYSFLDKQFYYDRGSTYI